MRIILIVWLLAMGVVLGPAIHQVYVDHQADLVAYEADMVEGNQR